MLSSLPAMSDKLSLDTMLGEREPIAQPVCERTSLMFATSTAIRQNETPASNSRHAHFALGGFHTREEQRSEMQTRPMR